jgi:hypothetical protein
MVTVNVAGETEQFMVQSVTKPVYMLPINGSRITQPVRALVLVGSNGASGVWHCGQPPPVSKT